MLTLVGLGLHDARDISVKGLEAVRLADVVYAEFYTAILEDEHEGLEEFLEREVVVLPRSGVEEGGRRLLSAAKDLDVVLLTAGDPLTATTHADLLTRARSMDVKCRVIHASSILTAAPGILGLQHYKFGRTVSVVRPEKKWSPTSPLEAILKNRENGLHTLVLLDIKSDEGYFMTAPEAMGLLLQMAERLESGYPTPDSPVAVIARAGGDVEVRTGAFRALGSHDFGPPLHCIILPGDLHVAEEEAWDSWGQD